MFRKMIFTGLLLGSLNLYSSEKVYIVPKGKVYHYTKNCKTLSKSKGIQEIEKNKVENRRPCKVCY